MPLSLQADLAAMVTPIKTKHVSTMSMTDAVELQKQQEGCVKVFEQWGEEEQVQFITSLLGRMCHHQHGQVNQYLKPMLQRDFITALPGTVYRLIVNATRLGRLFCHLCPVTNVIIEPTGAKTSP